jgi:hypothetical protein
VLRLFSSWQVEVCDRGVALDRRGEPVERDRQPPARRPLDGQLVVATANVLNERVARDDDAGAAVLLQAPHRSQPRLQAAVVGLDTVVGIPIGAMPGRRDQLLDHQRVRRRSIGHDLHRPRLGAPTADAPRPTTAPGSPPRSPLDLQVTDQATTAPEDPPPVSPLPTLPGGPLPPDGGYRFPAITRREAGIPAVRRGVARPMKITNSVAGVLAFQ